jgi:hypothetical protein
VGVNNIHANHMTISNLELGYNQGSTNYGPFSYGSFAGTPVVDMAVSKSEQKEMPVQSIESIFDDNNWKRKVRSGFARLQYNGKNIFDESLEEGIKELSRILGATFVDFEVRKRELKHGKPPRGLRNIADYYRVFVPDDYDFDEDVLSYYAEQSNSYGNAEFIFKVDSHGDDNYISDVVREYSIYDSDVWLFPRGWKTKTVSKRQEIATKMAKRHTWNLSPRLGILADAQNDE